MDPVFKQIDQLISEIETVPGQRKYWLIRTQSGSLYEAFRTNGFVAIEHEEITLSLLYDLKKVYAEDEKGFNKALREIVQEKNNEEHSQPGLIASQIVRFVYEVKKGDIVIIPSENSFMISFGIVDSTLIPEISEADIEKTNCNYRKRKLVNWVKDVRRDELDPYLFRMLQAHQAINDATGYSEIIERTINNFFVFKNEARLVFEVKIQEDIPAKDVFGLGYELLRLIDDFAQYYQLDISSNDIQTKIVLNSPGKIDLKSKFTKTIFYAGLIILVGGGGYKSAQGHQLFSEGVPALLDAVSRFLNQRHQREMQDKILNKYMDSLQVKEPKQLVELLKQVSENKDKPK